MPSSSSHTQIDLADFDKLVGSVSTEVSSQAIGGRVLSVSDEWFAPFVLQYFAPYLLTPELTYSNACV